MVVVRVRASVHGCWIAAVLMGCSFSSPSAEPTTDGGTGVGSGGAESAGPGPSTMTTAATSDSQGTTTASTTAGTGQPQCGDPRYSAIVWAADATVTPPMSVSPAWGGLSGMPPVAWGTEAEQGSAVFEFDDIPCAGQYFVWGLVWDLVSGASPCPGDQHADSFLVYDQNQVETFWAWGCRDCGGRDRVWAWRPLDHWVGPTCEEIARYSIDLQPGATSFELVVREFGEFSDGNENVPAIAALLITDDRMYDPTADFPP